MYCSIALPKLRSVISCCDYKTVICTNGCESAVLSCLPVIF